MMATTPKLDSLKSCTKIRRLTSKPNMQDSNKAQLVATLHQELVKRSHDFVVRESQKTMITRALGLFARSAVGLVEAPTGTGKSLGYLLPGLVTSMVDKRVLVIATATASLQDQLANDIPKLTALFRACGLSTPRLVVAKGRERHVCPVRLLEVTGTKDMFNGEDDKSLDRLGVAFEAGSWDGLRDTLPEPVSSTQWQRVNNTSSTCIGKRCPQYEECPYYTTQELLKEADVVITNHDYLLTCIAHIPTSPLANESNIYVFDEAHHLGQKLLAAFAHRLDLGSLPEELIQSVLPLCAEHRRRVEIAAEQCREHHFLANQMFSKLTCDRFIHRFPHGQVKDEMMEVLRALSGSATSLLATLDDARNSLRQMRKGTSRQGPRNNSVLDLGEMKLSQLIGEVAAGTACLEQLCSEETLARWISKGVHGAQINCSPFDASSVARRHLWPVVKTALLTSATLATMGDFKPTLMSLGLPATTSTLKLATPFDYSRARMVVPRLAVDGTDRMHPRITRAFVADKALRSTDHQGVLVYFTSRKLMITCYEYLAESERELVLLQGDWQPSALLAEHRRRIDAGHRSIIFGMDSMGEGVDLPGSYCTRVIVARLPFPSPDDPVIATHAEYLEQKGIDPFHILTLALAGRKFAQVVGRLMRREDDGGEVLVLDRRILSKRYGQRILRGTEFRQVVPV